MTIMFKELIWVKKNSLTKSFCKKIIKKFEKDSARYEGLIDQNNPRVDKNIKKTTDLCIKSADLDWKKEDEILFKALKTGLNEYNEYLKSIHIKCVPHQGYKMVDTGYKIQKYDPDGFYDWHNDWCISPSGSRIFVFMWYLNSIKKKDGGGTEFFDGTKLQPECGSLVFFPSTWTYVHRGCQTKVEKYLCNGWIYSRPSNSLLYIE